MHSLNKHISKLMAMVMIAGSITIFGGALDVKADEISEVTTVERAATKNGFVEENGKTYNYVNGKKAKGWVEKDGEKYYFLNDYSMAKSMYRTIKEVRYYFKADGTLASNEIAKTTEGMFRFNADGTVVKGETYAQVGKCDFLNIREKADADSAIKAKVYTGDVVKLLGDDGNWDKIETKDGVQGWVNATYLEYCEVSSKVEKVISVAKAQMGKPYKWGATGPNSFDCSGLMYYSYKNGANITLPRVSRDQANAGVKVSKEDLKPGDLVFFGSGSRITHVGMYLGNDQYIHSPQTGDVVKISKLSARKMITARRIIQ
ncbi:C40 family peptidase [Peptacetobacter hominis]|nr:NlpC/P60 family protein [Peptacetobacter hominis]